MSDKKPELKEEHYTLLRAIRDGGAANAGPFFLWARQLAAHEFITLSPCKITGYGRSELERIEMEAQRRANQEEKLGWCADPLGGNGHNPY